MLDTWALQVLVAVADHGSFSGAAEALSMTQPAVSRQIAGLERRVGVRLFTRVPRGVRPTAAGEVAVEMARDSLARLRALEARLASFAQLASGELRLSAFTSANIVLVPEAFRRFAGVYPGVSLSLLQTDQEALLTAVRDGRIDLALITDWHLHRDRDATGAADASLPRRAVDGAELIPLLAEELWVALPAGTGWLVSAGSACRISGRRPGSTAATPTVSAPQRRCSRRSAPLRGSVSGATTGTASRRSSRRARA